MEQSIGDIFDSPISSVVDIEQIVAIKLALETFEWFQSIADMNFKVVSI
jgi:hypothetical protein